MTSSRRNRPSATAVLIAILFAACVAPVAGAQPQAHASSAREVHASTPTSEGSAFGPQQQGGNSRDVLEKALLTVAAAAAAGGLGLVGYLIRKRVGFWPHRPQAKESAPSEEHH